MRDPRMLVSRVVWHARGPLLAVSACEVGAA